MDQLIWLYCVLALLSGFMKVGFGFGAGVFLNPVLGLFMNPTLTTGILAPILWFSNIDGLRTHIRRVNWRLVRAMLPFCIIGTVIGGGALVSVPEHLVRQGIGWMSLLLVSIALIQRFMHGITEGSANPPQTESVLHRHLKAVVKKSISPIMCSISGFVGSTANSGGLPLTFLFSWIKLTKEEYTSNMITLLSIMDTVKIVSFLVLGILSPHHFLLAFCYIPFIYLGGFIGKWVNQRLNERSFFMVIYGFIAFVSIILVL